MQTYTVRPVPMFQTGTRELSGYVPFIVRELDGGIIAFAVADGNYTGAWQPKHATPEEAMAYYEACESNGIRLTGNRPYAHLLRIPTAEVRQRIQALLEEAQEAAEVLDSTAEAVEEN